ncbi:RNA polymerase sigma factor [Zafaria sp. Z1313]|uniref:RNA polymerase sigma factor n=1 Tax=Zafaria sp. Z1313 TaxID=3423202 RepID=UPI003D303548
MAAVLTDEVLEKARQGSAEALSVLYEGLAGQVAGYLRAKGVEDAEGTTQDVFLTVLTQLDTVVGGIGGLRKFTFSVAHARMVDATRARARRPYEDEYQAESDPRAAAPASEELLDRLDSGPLGDVVDALPEAQRDCVLLRIVAGLSIEETAEVLGRTPGAVKQLQRRGLLAMKKTLEEVGHRG